MEDKKNMFIRVANFESTTLTENGASAFSTTGSKIVDQFGKTGNYRGRELEDVFKDQSELWDENPELAMRFPLYLRMVTRKQKVSQVWTTKTVQSGQGARDESFKRLLWVAKNHPSSFYKNVWMIPVVGSWKDLWTLMFYDIDLEVNAIDDGLMFSLMSEGLSSETHVDLVKKFMPRIKSMKKCTTKWTKVTNDLAKLFATFLGLTAKEYNKLKATGKAHDFQKAISNRKYSDIDWNRVPGRALTLLSTGKFMENHDLVDNYIEWLEKQPSAKFTGYPYELMRKYRIAKGGKLYYGRLARAYLRKEVSLVVRKTLDAQFSGLVEKARQDGKITENVLCALDTSGSMNCEIKGLNDVTCGDVATSLALFFSELNTGAFHNKVFMFDSKSYAYDIKEENFCDKIDNLPSVPCGGTNFQSVIDELVKIRRNNPEIPLEDYPTTILVVSDMQFNPTESRWRVGRREDTNYEVSVDKLKEVFPEEYVDGIKFIWWDCAGRRETYETNANTPGSYFFSGFDGSIINIILGEDEDDKKPNKERPTAEEIVIKALSQEILSYVVL